MTKKHRIYSFWLNCTDLSIVSVMAAYTKRVIEQLGLLNKQFSFIQDGCFLIQLIYQHISSTTFSAEYAKQLEQTSWQTHE